MYYAQSSSEDIAAVEALFAGDYPVETESAVVVSGAGELVEFTVLGKITASGKYTPCVLTATDGSEVAAAILVYPVDATSADVTAQVYKSGSFNMDALTWDASFTTEALKLAASAAPLFIKKCGPSV